MDLVAKLWNFCHTLRHEGVDYNDYIEELTYLIFLKLSDDREIFIPEDCTWNELIKYEGEDLLRKYNNVLYQLSNEPGILKDIFSEPIAKIRNSSSLKKLLVLIDDVNWHEYDEDILGAMFEGLLDKAASEGKKGAGQYFTPRPLIDSIVRVMKPDPYESKNFKVADVASGTAGFLISSFEWAKSKYEISKLNKSQTEKLYNKTYFGQELVRRPRRLAQMNLYLHGIDPSNILLGDTIYDPYDAKKDGTFSCVLTNPPFGTKGSNQIPDRNFKIKTSNKQLNFIQHIYSCLEDRGRAAIILPDNVLFEEKAAEIWKYVMTDCNVHTILKLPRGTFAPYAQGVKACVIFMQKGIPTKDVWIYDARSNVKGVTKRGRPLSFKNFEDFEVKYGVEPNGNSTRSETEVDGRFRKFSISMIKKENYRLDINWLNDDAEDSYSDLSSEKIVRETIDQVNDMLVELKEILNLLEG
jgi:type I restriction enzyme M protein